MIWNECSLVKEDDGVKTANVQTGKHPVAVDRKIKFVVHPTRIKNIIKFRNFTRVWQNSAYFHTL